MAGEGLFPGLPFGFLRGALRGQAAPPPRPAPPEATLRDRDGQRAERARALAELVASPHWWAVRDALTEGFQETLVAVTDGVAHHDTLRVYTGLVDKLDATFKIGELAMQRIVERQLTGVSAVQQQRRPPSGRLTTPSMTRPRSA